MLSSSPLSSPPCNFEKIFVVDYFIEKFYFENFSIRDYFKKDLLKFSFHWYDTIIIQFFCWKNPHQLTFIIFNEVSQSNIFLVFFLCTWWFKINRIFIISVLKLCSVNLISICSFSSFSFSSELLLLYSIKALATGRLFTKFFLWDIFTLCVFTALLQDQTILIWLSSPKLIYKLFLIYS